MCWNRANPSESRANSKRSFLATQLAPNCVVRTPSRSIVAKRSPRNVRLCFVSSFSPPPQPPHTAFALAPVRLA